MSRKSREQLQNALEKNRLLEQQYEILQHTYGEHASLFHDMNHHLQVIYHMAEQAHNQEIADYVSHITTPVTTLAQCVFTGVEIVDAILNSKQKIIQQNGFLSDINVELPVNTGISSEDYCSLLSNLIDNAIEASQRIPAPKAPPLIQISIRRIHQFLVLQVSNPCPQMPRKKKGIFLTSKADASLHGWGLRSVKKTVAKYNGSLQCEVKDGQFTATAMLFFPAAPASTAATAATASAAAAADPAAVGTGDTPETIS